MNLKYDMASAEVASAITQICPELYAIFSYLVYNLNSLGRDVTVIEVKHSRSLSVGVKTKNNHKAEDALEYLTNRVFDSPGISKRSCKFLPNGAAGFFELYVPDEKEKSRAKQIMQELQDR